MTNGILNKMVFTALGYVVILFPFAGNDAHGYEDIVPSENVVAPKCLTVYKSLISPKLRLEWASCSGRYRHICNVGEADVCISDTLCL